MQTPISQLLSLADAYGSATGRSRSAVSKRVFNDGKVLENLANGGDMTIGRHAMALRWFSVNWPEGVKWPSDISRPASSEAA